MDEIRRGSRGPVQLGNTGYGVSTAGQVQSSDYPARAPPAQHVVYNDSPSGRQATPIYSGATAASTATGYSSPNPYPTSGQTIRVNEPYTHLSTPPPTHTTAAAPYHTPQTAPTYNSHPGYHSAAPGGGSNYNDDSEYAVGGALVHHGRRDKVPTRTKGALYDETGGAIDDRTRMQKLSDKFSTGSAVGKHTSDVAGWAPGAGPSHGYNPGTGPTRFTAGNVATDADYVGNSRNDITGPVTHRAGNTVNLDEPPRYITNEFGDVVGTEPRGAGVGPSHANTGGYGHHQGSGNPLSQGGDSRGARPYSNTGSGSSGVAPYDEGPQYITNEFGDVLGTQPRHGGGVGPHSHINPSHSGVTTRGGLVGGSGDYETIGHEGIKVNKATRGRQYDATGGAIDDRTTGQKIKDAFIPGNSVGNHTREHRHR